MRWGPIILANLAWPGLAAAEMTVSGETGSHFNETLASLLAVEARSAAAEGAIRLSIYDSEDAFLKNPIAKLEAAVDHDGFAIFELGSLAEGPYAFVAYYDENRDGKLNKSVVGLPRERFAFSNGVRPRFRRPRFEETKVLLQQGMVVNLKIDD